MPQTFVLPRQRALDDDAHPLAGALLYFSRTSTSEPQAVFVDAALTTQHENPVPADSSGEFPKIYLNPSAQSNYRVRLTTADGVQLYQEDDIDKESTVSSQSIGLALYPRTQLEVDESIVPVNYLYPPGNVLRYGVNTDPGTTDMVGAIQSALDLSAAGGPSAFLPAGRYKTTAPLLANNSCSMYGEGRYSIIEPDNCDGLTFQGQDTAAAGRFFRDFSLITSSGDTRIGIKCDLDSGSGGRITGVLFEALYIEGFDTGVMARGMWNCTFSRCYLFDHLTGFYIFKRSIDFTILNCAIVRTTVHASETKGIVTDEADSLRPEDVRVLGGFVYGHDINIDMAHQLNGSVIACDIDNSLKRGVRLTQVDGGFVIRDCWIATTDSPTEATMGIELVALGSARNTNLTIDNNYITCNGPITSSVGVRNNANQNMVTVVNNRLVGWYDGVYNNGGNFFTCTNNSIDADNLAIFLYSEGGLSADSNVGRNHIESGTALTFSAAGVPARFRGAFNGSFTATLTGCTASPTGTVQYAVDGNSVRFRLPDITGTSNTTAATLTGVPTTIRPRIGQTALTRTIDNGVTAVAAVVVNTDGTITLAKDAAGGAFTNSGTKGVAGCGFEYSLDG